jgi:LemA protein
MGDINLATLCYSYYFWQKYWWAFVLAPFLILLLLIAGLYNALVRAWVRVGEAWSGIDVQLRRRASLIPNLVETVKGYAGHERHVFEEVTRTRSALDQARGAAETARADQALTQALGRLFAVAENYPQLRASENFMELQKDLADVEEKIAYARQFYNSNVQNYNARIQSVPTLIFARLFDFQAAPFFQAEEEARSEVKVDFRDLK